MCFKNRYERINAIIFYDIFDSLLENGPVLLFGIVKITNFARSPNPCSSAFLAELCDYSSNLIDTEWSILRNFPDFSKYCPEWYVWCLRVSQKLLELAIFLGFFFPCHWLSYCAGIPSSRVRNRVLLLGTCSSGIFLVWEFTFELENEPPRAVRWADVLAN